MFNTVIKNEKCKGTLLSHFFFYTTSKHIVFISLIFKNQRYNKQNSIKKKKENSKQFYLALLPISCIINKVEQIFVNQTSTNGPNNALKAQNKMEGKKMKKRESTAKNMGHGGPELILGLKA